MGRGMNAPLFLLLLLITACIILITVCNNNNLCWDGGKRISKRKLEGTNRGVELFRHLAFTWQCGWREWTTYKWSTVECIKILICRQTRSRRERGKMHRHLSSQAKVSVSVMSKWIVKLIYIVFGRHMHMRMSPRQSWMAGKLCTATQCAAFPTKMHKTYFCSH